MEIIENPDQVVPLEARGRFVDVVILSSAAAVTVGAAVVVLVGLGVH